MQNLFLLRKVVLCSILAFVGCSAAILAALSKNSNGGYDYNTAAAPFLAETLKLFLSLFFFLSEHYSSNDVPAFSWISFVKYGILGILYAFQNNLLFYTLKYVDAATFQVVANLKIPLNALLLRSLAGRKFSRPQWIGLCLLIVGASSSQLHGGKGTSRFGHMLAISPKGAFYIAIMICISSFAGVFNELLLKDSALGSMHWQNFQLYLVGCISSFLILKYKADVFEFNIFYQGFNIFTWLSILNLASLGIVTSAVLKHADNVLKSFAAVFSMLLATVASFLLLGTSISWHFLVGILITSLAILIYTGVVDKMRFRRIIR